MTPEGGNVEIKNIRAAISGLETKADDGTAEFTGYASVFGVIDSYGDIVAKGAFARSLAEWSARGAPIPVLWGHNMADPDYNIGSVIEAHEDEHGLKVRCSLDLESPKARSVHRLLKAGRVREMSFAFTTKSARDGEQDGRYVRFVDDVDLHEVSVVPLGANPETDILAVRSTGELKPMKKTADALVDAARSMIRVADELVLVAEQRDADGDDGDDAEHPLGDNGDDGAGDGAEEARGEPDDGDKATADPPPTEAPDREIRSFLNLYYAPDGARP